MSQKPRNRVGATPAKLALIGVLALVMVGVIASNFSGGQSPPVAAAAEGVEHAPETTASGVANSSAGSSAAPQADDAANPFGKFAEVEPWPKAPLKTVTRFDPFARAAWAVVKEVVESDAAAEEQDSARKLDELRNAENAIIIMSGDTRKAVIGEHEFQIGDVIGRFRIEDITSSGVVLSEIEGEE